MADDVVALDRDVGDVAAIDVGEEIGEGQGGLRPRLDEVWKRLKIATSSSPMTIHRARFLPKLFT